LNDLYHVKEALVSKRDESCSRAVRLKKRLQGLEGKTREESGKTRASQRLCYHQCMAGGVKRSQVNRRETRLSGPGCENTTGERGGSIPGGGAKKGRRKKKSH